MEGRFEKQLLQCKSLDEFVTMFFGLSKQQQMSVLGDEIRLPKVTVEHMIRRIPLEIRKITTDDIREYLAEYQKMNSCGKVTVDNVRRNLSSFFSWLEEEDYILKSPMRRIHKIKTKQAVKEVITDEMIEQLRDHCKCKRDLAMIDLLYSTGIRVGELVGLNRTDINFGERECVVYGKGDKERRVYFDAKSKGGKTPTTKMKEVKSMAKKIGIIVLLCFSLCVGGVSAFANEGHDETDTQTLIETQHPVSSVLFRQDGADIQQSTDEGKTWQSYSPIEETDYFTYDEFSAWIENETENIQKLVDAGEWTEAEATEALEYYDEILKSILEGKMVGKRASSSDDQLFFSMPDNAQPEQYQTFVFDGNTYKSIGPFDTEEELFNALKEYTDTEVEAGTMSQAEATALLEKYQ